ncbi:Aryl-phospho-beta-D-glucosidase BglC, GH1 family [Flavobacterium sp. CF108]|uniref:cellulase family glycosylhydrolase n=1 Tax=unclassified Flavobacterium TaxID=196869 RepID=UPI0008ABE353|nr:MULTISPECIES: cellulase family glycosylhydrolase [unclassified Flavobacterium]SEP12641.1 Aryl-phospho-beta-D-glucosidase BglC, GH1 family [Flavobacterium sp. fv08]SHH51897.1 Aryl-phospho-beta-D-glucosidase BglC, GH1 family [Flavobacterium sp. CF108]
MKNTIKIYLLSSILCFSFLSLWACSSDKEEEKAVTKTLTVDTNKIDFVSKGSEASIKINTNVTAWTISNPNSSWIQISQAGGTSGTITVKITALENTSTEARTATITINSGETSSVQIAVTQAGAAVVAGLYPNYNTNPIAADQSGMSSTAVQLAGKIKLGWNIGNTMEAIGGETAWGNPKVTKALIDAVKANGFNAIRIPCSWNQYVENSATAKIKTEWLDRVKEVVQYCVDNDMYVLVNIHWDGGWLENNITEAKKVENNAKQKAFWEQIATHLRGFDEHLLFASANEPAVEDAAQMAVLTSYHQTFINAVRSTGGKNAYRTLVVQGPTTDIEKTNKLMTALPTDSAANRMMVEVHYYSPWNFAGLTKDETWGKMFYYWGANYHSTTDTERNATYGEEADLEKNFKLMKTQFVDKGIPVLLGEFGAIRRTTLTGDALTLHLASRAYYLKMVVKTAKANGLLPFYWDEGSLGNNGFGIFKRSDNTVFDTQALTALKEGLQ